MAAFTRQHYVEVARILSGVRDPREKQRLADEFGRMFQKDNPAFDGDRFAKAVHQGRTDAGINVREGVEESKALTAARAKLAAHGYSIQKTEYGDYRVYPKGSRRPDEGYFTDNLDDAVATGIQMATDGGDHLVHAARRTARPAPREADAGFAISVNDQRDIEDNAHSTFGPKHGEQEDRDRAMKAGVVDSEGRITQKGWDQLGNDITRIERNSMAWMRKTFVSARDEGHDKYSDLTGSFWFDPANHEQARLVELAADTGRQERIDMQDSSYGDLANAAFTGVSDFGSSVLGGSITFFDVKPEDMDALVATLDRVDRQPKGSKR
jgi:hypothetical protein